MLLLRASQVIPTLGRTLNTSETINKGHAHVHFELNVLVNDHFAAWFKKNAAGERYAPEAEYHAHPCRRLVIQHGSRWELTDKGVRELQMLTYRFSRRDHRVAHRQSLAMRQHLGSVLIWSARTRPRFGPPRHLTVSDSGDLSPPSKSGHCPHHHKFDAVSHFL
jgi:hypothetical protein